MRLLSCPPVLAVVCLSSFAVAAAETPAELAKKAQAILKERCYSCHGEGGTAEGGVNYVLDVSRLVSRGKLIAGSSVRSKLYTQVKTGNMPKDMEPLSKGEIETLKRWIDAGASDFNPPVAKRDFISTSRMFEYMKADLDTIDSQDRPLIRYFTLTHLYNAGLSDDELTTYRHGLVKLINSLSWAPAITVPHPIDPSQTIYRLNIRRVEWSAATWNDILAQNPYGVTFTNAAASACYRYCETPQPFIRGDWFVARASVPPLYHDILKLPKTDKELEKKLLVDVRRNLQTGNAARAGFNGSGVSNNNRLIERHRSNMTRGAYWKSYDFGGNDGDKNLFANPAGADGQDTFHADGGELIFNLPNGLQGYMLIDGKGQRIDKGPTSIVSDPKRPDRAVVNGLSCMSCHAKGIIEKDDQVRDIVFRSPNGYTLEARTGVQALYPPKEDFVKLLSEDKQRFAKAVEATGAALGDTEPIVTLALRFEEVVDLRLAAAEAGVSPTEMTRELGRSSELARSFGALNVPGGTVQREVYLANYGLIVRELKLGTHIGKTSPLGSRAPVTPQAVSTSDSKLITSPSTGMKLALIPAGTFQMGASAIDLKAVFEMDTQQEIPQHPVRITQPFYMGVYEVTQWEFEDVLGRNPSRFSKNGRGKSEVSVQDTSKFPVEQVTWYDATEFCNKLSVADGRKPYYSLTDISRNTDKSIKSAKVVILDRNHAGKASGYRLPTEAEWEYACRANTTSMFHFGNFGNDRIGWKNGDNANFSDRSDSNVISLRRTTTVGSYSRNAFGLHDMHGNVKEWCEDVYDFAVYAGRSGITVDPLVLKGRARLAGGEFTDEEFRVIRGGYWESSSELARSAYRSRRSPGISDSFGESGFRVVCSGRTTP